MKFAIKHWVSDDTRPTSIFAVANKDIPVNLPTPTGSGRWVEFSDVEESQFLLVEDAKACIAEHGYYLMGAGVSITQAFGQPNKTPF
jgi:hypothetical protein